MRRYGNVHVGAEYTFGDLWDARIAANVLALEEGVLKARWSQGRVVLLGDSCHKVFQLATSSLFPVGPTLKHM
jgi:hypothetical protein